MAVHRLKLLVDALSFAHVYALSDDLMFVTEMLENVRLAYGKEEPAAGET